VRIHLGEIRYDPLLLPRRFRPSDFKPCFDLECIRPYGTADVSPAGSGCGTCELNTSHSALTRRYDPPNAAMQPASHRRSGLGCKSRLHPTYGPTHDCGWLRLCAAALRVLPSAWLLSSADHAASNPASRSVVGPGWPWGFPSLTISDPTRTHCVEAGVQGWRGLALISVVHAGVCSWFARAEGQSS